MDHAVVTQTRRPSVGVREGFRGLHHHKQCEFQRPPPVELFHSLGDFANVLAGDVLHRHVVLFVFLPGLIGRDHAEVEDLYDIGMLQQGDQLGFSDEEFDVFRLVEAVREDPFDGEGLLEPGGDLDPRFPHFGHSSGSNPAKQRIAPQLHQEPMVLRLAATNLAHKRFLHCPFGVTFHAPRPAEK